MESVGRSETGSPNHKSRLSEASDGSAGRASVVVARRLLPPPPPPPRIAWIVRCRLNGRKMASTAKCIYDDCVKA